MTADPEDPFVHSEDAVRTWEQRAVSGLAQQRVLARLWLVLGGWLLLAGIATVVVLVVSGAGG